MVAGVRLLFYPRFCFSTKRKTNRTPGKAVCLWAHYPTPMRASLGGFTQGMRAVCQGVGCSYAPRGDTSGRPIARYKAVRYNKGSKGAYLVVQMGFMLSAVSCWSSWPLSCMR